MSMKTEAELIIEMAEQGEFACLAITPRRAFVHWWCRRTDRDYEASDTTLLQSLHNVLHQARTETNPWVDDDTCAATAARHNIDIYIPEP